ncbi:MAG: redoxin domain-containing protein [Bacteroidota bacterium]
MRRKLLCILLLLPMIAVAQQELSGTFTPPESYKWGILYEVTPTGTRYAGDTKIDNTGAFTMTLDTTVTSGVYRFVFGVPPEANNFEFIYSGRESIVISFAEDKGVSFESSDENKRWQSYREIMGLLQDGIDLEYQKDLPNQLALDSLFDRQESVFHLYRNSSQGNYVSSFIEASRPFVPDSTLHNKDYRKAKSQFMIETLRYDNPVLQRSGFLMKRTVEFIEESPFHYEKTLNLIAHGLLPCTQEFKKVFLLRLWEQLQASYMINEANYLASAFLIPVATRTQDLQLSRMLEVSVNTSVGAIAPDFSWKDSAGNNRTLRELDMAENYILVFWSSTCSHCLSELPKLQEQVRFLPKGTYQVIAFGLEDDIYNWRNESLRLPEFLHVPGLGKWQNETGNDYNVTKTPTYYVLDREKVIRAKPDSLEALIEIIRSE